MIKESKFLIILGLLTSVAFVIIGLWLIDISIDKVSFAEEVMQQYILGIWLISMGILILIIICFLFIQNNIKL